MSLTKIPPASVCGCLFITRKLKINFAWPVKYVSPNNISVPYTIRRCCRFYYSSSPIPHICFMGVRGLESKLLRKPLGACHLFNGNPSVATKVIKNPMIKLIVPYR